MTKLGAISSQKKINRYGWKYELVSTSEGHSLVDLAI